MLILSWAFQISDVADKDIGKLDKSFKEGNSIRVRILGYRHLEGLATGTLKVVFSALINYDCDFLFSEC